MSEVIRLKPNEVNSEEPLRLLSIAGGGLRGIIPAAFLERFYALGSATYGSEY